jgi:sialidase-1
MLAGIPLLTLVLIAPVLQADQPAPSELPTASVPVFQAGEDGFPAYRIPSLVVTAKGSVLAFAEGRANGSDHARNKIVLKRSTDGGRNWGKLHVVAEDGDNSLNNPCAIALPAGRVLLVYQRYPKSLDEHNTMDGVAGDQTSLSFLTVSDDDGATWGTPVDITAQVKRPKGVTSHCSGPGIGAQLTRGEHKGRIMVPFNQGPYGKWEVYAAWSDDQGQTWKYGDVAPGGQSHRPNEVQFVELSDGRVMLNARGMAGEHFRKTAVSADGGQTWSALADDRNLLEPRCMASIIRASFPDGGSSGLILYSGPNSQNRRAAGTIRGSDDDGQTWKLSRELVPGVFGYSCLALLPDGSVGCLYESEISRKINFVRFTLAWLKGGE